MNNPNGMDINEMAEYARTKASLLLQYKLSLYSPSAVYEWFMSSEAQGNDSDEALMRFLLGRNEPLIDLGLAQHCRYDSVINDLWLRTKDSFRMNEIDAQALRLAILSNTTDKRTEKRNANWYSINLTDLANLLQNAAIVEIEAIFENPSIDETLLISLFRKEDLFESLNEKRWLDCLFATLRNSRKWEDAADFDNDVWEIKKLQEAAYYLPSIAPLTELWAVAVSGLLKRISPPSWNYVSKEMYESTMQRWKHEAAEKSVRPVNHWDEVRIYYGRMFYGEFALNTGQTVNILEMVKSEDVAIRCLAYGFCKLQPEQISFGAEQDKNDFLRFALENKFLFVDKVQRLALRDECVRIDSDYLCYWGWQYSECFARKCEELKMVYPQWDWDLGQDLTENSQDLIQGEIMELQKSVRFTRNIVIALFVLAFLWVLRIF
ncbi:hypothetical protein [Undibacterium rugosum]|uniref:hypothetical protein n=1 Tax=Undibacterium rugosum TaxID=2762291 RepID=UPI001B81A738|nr:hypothetical protein [Undibacterium rugosum]MBR7777556.1 hypothetical protein [Undibacterium rugosum]